MSVENMRTIGLHPSQLADSDNSYYLLKYHVLHVLDPYFPFENAVDVWARSFAAMGITYRGATMRLDLCDR